MRIQLRNALRLSAIMLFVLFLSIVSPLAFSQGCSLCYTQAANSGARMIGALRNGIVILIIPPLSICLAAMVLVYRKRNQFREYPTQVEGKDNW